MPTYAILGATGKTGQCIVSNLLAQPSSNLSIHALVRSRSKLEKQLESPTPANVIIHEGAMSDIPLLVECVKGTQAVFITVGPPGNMPDCAIMQDTVNALIPALRQIHAEKGAKVPKIVLLSSAAIESYLCEDIPYLVHQLLLTASHYIYEDLRVAEALLRAESAWLACTFVKPGGLSHDVPVGHKLSTERQHTFISFSDLAAGMIDVAGDEVERWDQANVSVLPKDGSGAHIPWGAMLVELPKSVLCYWVPRLYQYFY
ncbi:MAG: hypothetical protein M1831_007487 [Alyxoria varia]|nr:MAG: hypothetical protein M1831_007487 [Alyxoria varia]